MKTFMIKIDLNERCPCCRLADCECLYLKEPDGDCDGDMSDRPDWCPLVEILGYIPADQKKLNFGGNDDQKSN